MNTSLTNSGLLKNQKDMKFEDIDKTIESEKRIIEKIKSVVGKLQQDIKNLEAKKNKNQYSINRLKTLKNELKENIELEKKTTEELNKHIKFIETSKLNAFKEASENLIEAARKQSEDNNVVLKPIKIGAKTHNCRCKIKTV